MVGNGLPFCVISLCVLCVKSSRSAMYRPFEQRPELPRLAVEEPDGQRFEASSPPMFLAKLAAILLLNTLFVVLLGASKSSGVTVCPFVTTPQGWEGEDGAAFLLFSFLFAFVSCE